jgi:TRAP-type mannitol/chloroaromatic compound transport system permease large subunit
MPFYEYLSIALMVCFILVAVPGYPVAWLLAGLSLIFAMRQASRSASSSALTPS